MNEKISITYENQITARQVYQILTCFDKIYFKMTDWEEKFSEIKSIWSHVAKARFL